MSNNIVNSSGNVFTDMGRESPEFADGSASGPGGEVLVPAGPVSAARRSSRSSRSWELA